MISLTNRNDLNMPICLIGVGGNGSYAVQSISQLLNVTDNKHVSLVVADPDIVEKHNLNNQLFVTEDVGKSKSKVLTTRYNSVYHVPVYASDKFSNKYVQSKQDIDNLVHSALACINVFASKTIPVIIGCVDNVYTRQIIGQYFDSLQDVIYIDVGVESYEKDAEDQITSGWCGQAIVGLKYDGQVISEPYHRVFSTKNVKDDNPASVSCQQAVVSNPQRIYCNRFAANILLGILNPLLTSQCLLHSQVFFNALTLESKTTFI